MFIAALIVLLQGPPVPTFSAQVQVVGVTVNAVDAKTGKPLAGLTLQDFQVLEDGKRQDVIHFSQEDVPASVLLLLDTSVSMKGLLPSVKEAATRLIRSLRSVDEVHVATFDDRYQMLCDFTTDHEEAVRSLEEVTDGKETALNWALYTATRLLEKRRPEQTQRRRILILMSDGENTHDSMTYESALDELRRSSVACYVVHLARPMYGASPETTLTYAAKRFVDSVVYETGGNLATVPYPYSPYDLRRAFADIADELGTQYHLVYATTADPNAGGWRAINVVMTSRSGVKLRFRHGYYIPRRR